MFQYSLLTTFLLNGYGDFDWFGWNSIDHLKFAIRINETEVKSVLDKIVKTLA